MTAKDLRIATCKNIVSGLAMENIIPLHWFECDLIEVRKSGYWHEYETKISTNDYAADFRKTRWMRDERGVVKKHDLLTDKRGGGPNRFYFVCPENLIAVEKVPPHAGLVYVSEAAVARIVKPAPLLHKEKFSFDRLWNIASKRIA